MAIQFLTYDDKNMESGKFYFIEANKDLAPNLREVTAITTPLNQATQDIISLKGKNDLQDIDINSIKQDNTNIKNTFIEMTQNIHDNTARINNIENIDLRTQFLLAMELASIKKNFTDTQEIVVQYGRKEVLAIRVNALFSSDDNKLIYKDVTSSVNIENQIEFNNEGIPIIKKIVVKSNHPITGYVLVL